MKFFICFQVHRNIHEVSGELKDPAHPFRCHVCSGVFKYTAVLGKHLATAHSGAAGAGAGSSLLRCDQAPTCPAQFADPRARNHHMVSEHQQDPFSAKKVWCPVCSQGFTRAYNLKLHMCKAHGKEMAENNVPSDAERAAALALTAAKLQHQQQSSPPKSSAAQVYHCQMCERPVSSKAELYVHVERDHGVILTPCPSCDERFMSIVALQDHISAVHGSPKHLATPVKAVRRPGPASKTNAPAEQRTAMAASASPRKRPQQTVNKPGPLSAKRARLAQAISKNSNANSFPGTLITLSSKPRLPSNSVLNTIKLNQSCKTLSFDSASSSMSVASNTNTPLEGPLAVSEKQQPVPSPFLCPVMSLSNVTFVRPPTNPVVAEANNNQPIDLSTHSKRIEPPVISSVSTTSSSCLPSVPPQPLNPIDIKGLLPIKPIDLIVTKPVMNNNVVKIETNNNNNNNNSSNNNNREPPVSKPVKQMNEDDMDAVAALLSLNNNITTPSSVANTSPSSPSTSVSSSSSSSSPPTSVAVNNVYNKTGHLIGQVVAPPPPPPPVLPLTPAAPPCDDNNNNNNNVVPVVVQGPPPPPQVLVVQGPVAPPQEANNNNVIQVNGNATNVNNNLPARKKNSCCPVCGVHLSPKTNVNVHLRTHSGVRPYECVLCLNRFRQKAHLMKHFRCSHNQKKPPHVCQFCQLETVTSNDLYRHITDKHTAETDAMRPGLVAAKEEAARAVREQAKTEGSSDPSTPTEPAGTPTDNM